MIKPIWLKILCCPLCKNKLLYKKDLNCSICNKRYLIVDGIPILLSADHIHSLTQFQKQKKYFDKEYRDMDLKLQEWQKIYNKRIFELFKPNLKTKSFFIDIGIGGSGYTVIEAAKRGYLSVGCDLSLVGIKKAKYLSKKNKVSDNTFWVVCNAEELPFKRSTFRYLCANAILEHLPNDIKALSEIDRVSQVKADAYITTPLKYKYLWPFFIPLNYIHDKRIGHLRRYDQAEFAKKLSNTRFHIEKTFYTGHLIKTLLVLISMILKIDIFNKLAEKIDSASISKRFGASNISVYITNYKNI